MTRRVNPGLVAALLLALLPALMLTSGCTAAAPAAAPNVVLVVIDDLGWGDLGCYGNELHDTPAIDRLAAEGMRFTDAYAGGPNCAPTRACLMSGQYTPRHGVYTVNSSARGKAENRRLVPVTNRTTLADEVVTIAESLRDAGYETAHIGKWHLGPDPLTQGFDVNVGGNRLGDPKRYFSPYQVENLVDGPEGEYLTDRLTGEAVRFIESPRDRPFFLYLPHYGVHTPLRAKPDLVAKYQERMPDAPKRRAVYGAMIESVDQGIARIMASLDASGLDRETIVIVYSDNGGHGRHATNGPLRGAKGMLYEGGVRVPLIIRWPGHVEAGGRCQLPVTSVDLSPTLLELARATAPEDQPLDGESLVPVLTGAGTLPDRAIYWHFPAYLEAYGRGDSPWRTTPVRAIRRGDDKLLEFFEDGRLELYDVRLDMGETTNLAGSMPERTQALHQELVDWCERLDAPLPTRAPAP